MCEPSNSQPLVDAVSDEESIKHYKRYLENWREVLVYTSSLLLWDKSYYPGIIAGYITFVFITLWYFEPSMLSATALLGAIAFILDFTVPALSSNIFDPNKWTGIQERKYEEICQNLVQAINDLKSAYQYIVNVREKNPKMYFATVVGILLLVAWVGNVIDNLIFVYLVVLIGSLLPGIKHNGILQERMNSVTQILNGIFAEKVKKCI